MHYKSLPLSLLVALTSCIMVYGEPQAGTQTTTASTPTSTSLPNQISEPINITLDGKIFPPSINSADVTIPQDFSINCVDCAINGSVSLSAGGSIVGDKITTPSDVTEIPSDFDFDDYWIGATFDSLDASFEFGINLTASTTNNAFSIPIKTATISQTFDILTLTATVNTEIHGWLNTSNDVNLTYGFKFSVPPGSEIIVDLENIDQSLFLGFNESKIEPIPFSATTSDLDIGIELSFRPSVTFIASISAIVAKADVQLSVSLDVPKLDVEVKQVHNVNSTCDPAPASLPPDQVYQNLTILVPSIGFDAVEVFTETGKIPGLKLQADQPFEQTGSYNITTECYFFDAAKKTLGPAPVSQPSNVSPATSIRTPLIEVLLGITIAVFMLT